MELLELFRNCLRWLHQHRTQGRKEHVMLPTGAGWLHQYRTQGQKGHAMSPLEQASKGSLVPG